MTKQATEAATVTVTIYTKTLKEAILDGPLDDEDIAIVEEQFDNYLEYIATTQLKWGVEVELSESLHGMKWGVEVELSESLYGMSWSCSDGNECAMDCIKDFWEWY